MAHPLSENFNNGFSVPDHDFQEHSGTTAEHGPTQVIYKKGGPFGKLLATETIDYDANNYIQTRYIVWADDIFM